MTIFDVVWEELALEHVESFLTDAGAEGLTWEAKGNELPHPGSVAKHVCGFANAVDGGYLLLGADRGEDGTWSASGVEFPADDPPVWVTNIVRTLSPTPRVDVRDWQAGGGRRFAVVRVDPVAQPPCMTRGGQVFERVSGQTVAVTDPAELARLFGRGEVALERARGDAAAAAHFSLIHEPSQFKLAIGVASVGYEPGVEGRLFRRRTRDYLVRRFVERLQPNRYEKFQGARRRVWLDGLIAQMPSNAYDNAWAAIVSRSGAAGVAAGLNPDPEDAGVDIEILMEDAVRPAWDVASDLVEALGGSGRTAAAVRTEGVLHLFHRGGLGELHQGELDEWTAEPTPTGAELDHVCRQVLRSAGFEAWEPGD